MLVLARSLIPTTVFGLFASLAAPASAQDVTICFTAAERVEAGEELSEAEKNKAHEACVRAIAATASVVQKYQLQEADFAIMGVRHEF